MRPVMVLFLAVSSLLAMTGNQDQLLSKTRQLTFEGKRSGEGYFSADGSQMVFQSERDADNPFYQIFLMDLESGDVEKVSPGHGKTTCAWIHPDGSTVLFASTHEDHQARKKQKDELDFRASGKNRRYSWDYDPEFELFSKDTATGKEVRLTNWKGYDAEASYSPDGQWIAFSSNRHAFIDPLSEKDAETFKHDPSYMLDIYIMRADGSDLRRLTTSKGYDGGPFFSADGSRICWRRFAPDGATAEIYTMNLDGSDQRQLTRLGAMSWAPYFHPSGDYLIFATNIHGFANFELYLVDAAGTKEPVRVTEADGFDGLPVFTPDGKTLSWTSNRANKSSQIYMAEWNHSAALKLLGLDASTTSNIEAADLSETKNAIDAADMRRHVEMLASEAMTGRMTGSDGEEKATRYVASVFQALGLEPAGDNGTFFQAFPFVAGVDLGTANNLQLEDEAFKVNQDWRPIAFSQTGPVEASEVVFAGYGMKVPASEGQDEYDSYVHLDVKDKWVLVLRYMPEDIDSKRRSVMNRHASLRYKAMVARDAGARGLLVMHGPRTEIKEDLIKLSFDASLGGTSIPAISISQELGLKLFAASGKDLKEEQEKLDKGDVRMGIQLEGLKLSAHIDVQKQKAMGTNVIARLQMGDAPAETALAIGAHLDHLGRGEGGGSLARAHEKGQIHYGADDNASGTAALMEIAQYLMDLKQRGKLKMKRDIIFAGWSGEELGLLGSNHFAATWGGKKADAPLSPAIGAYLNMDMIGRLDKNLVLQGVGSSSIWKSEIERRNAPVGLPIITQNDSYLPTDATSFYLKGVPILAAFTGSHEDYHSPRDTPEKLNYEGARDIARFMALVARALVKADEAPDYQHQKRPENQGRRAVMRAYLGTIPDYAQGDVKGVKLSGVSKGGPAEKAGVTGGDVVVGLGEKKIENIYDYTYALEALKVGKETTITVYRDGKNLTLPLTPGSRD